MPGLEILWWALRDSNPEPRDYEYGPRLIKEHLDIDVSSQVNWHLLPGERTASSPEYRNSTLEPGRSNS